MPINLDPVVAAGNTLAYTENQPAATISPLAVVTDADSPDFDGGSLTVSLGASATADDFVVLIDQGTGTGQIGVTGTDVTYQGATIGTFSGGFLGSDLIVNFTAAAATPEAVQALLRDVHYGNISDDPNTADRTVTYTVTDGDGGTGTGSATITVAAVNDAPQNNVPLDQTVTEDTDLEFSVARGTAISVADPDARAGQESVILQVQHGTLTLADTSALTAVTGDGTNSVAFTGTLADINHALDGLIYRAIANYNGPDQLEIVTNDNGNTGGGSAQQDDDTIGITVIPQLDAPTDITGALAVNELAANGTSVGTLSTQDPDSNSFTYSLVNDAGGRFSIDAASGEVHVVNGLLLDFEQNATHNITVHVTDSNNQSLDKVLAVTINDVNPENVVDDGGSHTFFGGALDDHLDGAGGNDTLRGNGGNNTLIGGAGSDTADYGGAPTGVYFDFARGVALLNGFGGFDTISGIENVVASAHSDIIRSGPGDHQIDGAGGADAVDYSAAPTGVTADLSTGHAVNGFGGVDTLANIEAVLGSKFDDHLTGDSHDNVLFGDGGIDVMTGGAGNDTYGVDQLADQVIENPGEGTDAVHAGFNYALPDNVENLRLTDGALRGVGNGLANTIEGNDGDNFIDGSGGVDVMIGGNGDDTYFVDNSFDVVIEAGDSEGPPSEIRTGQAESSVGGNDAVWSTATYTLAPNVEILVLNGTADIDGTGNDLDNTIIGNSGNNRIDGAVGSDIMIGGAGNDTYFVDDLHDQVVEFAGEGIDTVNSTVGAGLTANVENLNLIGFGNINGVGNAGANTIVGNDGDNGIDGAGGADTLTGGLGNDTFIFGPGQANGDTVTDFSGNGAGTADRLMFSGYGPGATFTNIDPTHWQVNYNGATQHDIITFSNGAIIDPHDVFFV